MERQRAHLKHWYNSNKRPKPGNVLLNENLILRPNANAPNCEQLAPGATAWCIPPKITT